MSIWEDVIIGEEQWGTTAIKCFSIEGDHNISENRVSYWIGRGCILGLEGRISKATEEGKQLTDLIKKGTPLIIIQRQIDRFFLKHVGIAKLYEKIKELEKECFERGRESKAKEVRATLGVMEPW